MALFEQFKNWFASKQRRAVPKDTTVVSEMDTAPISAAGTARIADKEKLERFLQLTPREHELCLLLLEGFTLKECAGQLSVKYSTANTHMTGIYKKLGVNTRAELIINYRCMSKNSMQTQ